MAGAAVGGNFFSRACLGCVLLAGWVGLDGRRAERARVFETPPVAAVMGPKVVPILRVLWEKSEEGELFFMLYLWWNSPRGVS